MNSNLLFFIVFSIILFCINIFNIGAPEWMFLQWLLNNYIFQSIILSLGIYTSGRKYVKDIESSKNNTKLINFINILSNLFLLCLWFLAFQSIFQEAIFWFDMASYSIWKFFLEAIGKLQYMIVILAIAFGGLLFYINREEIENTEEEKEKKKNHKINKVIIFLFFLINLYFLDNINILPDETFHLFSGYWINDHLIPNINNNVIYLRWLLVSYVTSIWIYFNVDILFSLRLPSLLIGTIILLIISKLKNNTLIIIFLITNLFFIETSMYWRFYIYQMLVMLLVFLLILKNKNNYFSTKFHICFSILIFISIFISELYLYLLLIYFIIIFLNIIISKKLPNIKIIFIFFIITIISLYKLIYIKDLILIDEWLKILNAIWKSTTDINFIEYVFNKIKLNYYFLFLFIKDLSIYFIFLILGFFSLYKTNKYALIFIFLYLLLISITTIKNQPFTISFFIPIYWIIIILWFIKLTIKNKRKSIILTLLFIPWIITSIHYYLNLHVWGTPPNNIYISQAIRIHNDFEGPAEYVENYLKNKNRDDYLVISSYGISLPHSSYLNVWKPDYILWWYYKMFRKDSLWGYYEIFTKLKSIQRIETLKELNKNKDILIMTSYTSTDKFKNKNWTIMRHISMDTINFLYEAKDNILFIWDDHVSHVYFFKKWEISHLVR